MINWQVLLVLYMESFFFFVVREKIKILVTVV